MRTIGKAVAAAAMAVALLVAGALAFVRSPGRRRRFPLGRHPRPLLVPAVAAGSLDGHDRLAAGPPEGPAAGLARLRLARTRVRRAGQDHGRPVLVPEGEGRARPIDPHQRGRQRRGRRWGSGSWIWRDTTSRPRSDRAVTPRRSDPYSADAYGVIRGRAGRAGPIRPRVRRLPDDGGYPARPRLVRASPTLASWSATSAAPSARCGWRSTRPGRPRTPPGPRTSSASWRSVPAHVAVGPPVSTGAGLDLDPSYVPNLAGLAKVAWASGDDELAIARYTDVVARYPSAEFVVALADLYRVTGQPDLADRQEAVVDAMHRLATANGVNVDLELALFDADHGDPAGALAAARAEWARRQSVHVADAYAWALYANGRYARAAVARGPRPRARDAQRAVPVPRRDDPARARGRGRSSPRTCPGRSRRTRTSRSCTPPMPRASCRI